MKPNQKFTPNLDTKRPALLSAIHAFAAVAVVMASSASRTDAAVVSALPGSTPLPIPAINHIGTDTQTFVPGVTWSATATSVFGYSGPFGFLNNGFWNGLTMIGVDTDTGSMSINFATPVAGVGGFVNYSPTSGVANMSIYDSSDNLIESYTPSFLTSGGTALNEGQFIGFLLGTASISRLEFSNAYIGATDLQILSGPATSAIPEPSSALALCGLFAGSMMIRRRNTPAGR